MVTRGSASWRAVEPARRRSRGGLTRRVTAEANTANKHEVPYADRRFKVYVAA